MGNTHSTLPEGVDRAVPRTVPAVGTPNLNPDFAADPVAEGGKSVYEKSKEAAEADPQATQVEKYDRFRTEMFAYMLGEAAYDYAERLYSEKPNDPQIMGYLTETVWLYEKAKIERKRAHWIDRMDIMQRGIDVARRCINEHPDFFPCYRNYTLLALKASDQVYFWRWMRSMGNVENYEGLMKRGQQTMDMKPDFEVALGLAELNARAATWWCSPYRPIGLWYGIPARNEMLERSLHFHEVAHKLNPASLENTCRMAMVLFEQGRLNEARRWYIKVRDAMVPAGPSEEVWQSVAHTHLSMRFTKNRWNAQSG